MKTIDRFRRPQQLDIFEPPRILPSWRELPPETRKTVTKLLARMFQSYSRSRESEGRKGGGDE